MSIPFEMMTYLHLGWRDDHDLTNIGPMVKNILPKYMN